MALRCNSVVIRPSWRRQRTSWRLSYHLNVGVLDDHRLSNDELTDEIYEVVQLGRVKFYEIHLTG